MAENIKILADREDIVAIANAVRSKTGTSGEMTLGGIASGINGIEVSSNPVLQDKTVTPTTSSQNVTPDSGYDGLSSVTVNAMPTATQATPSISVSSNGLITTSATQTAGYVAAGTKSATKQLTTQAAKTITPTITNQTAVASGRYTTGAVTVKGDINLKAANIAEGVSIFGVTGTHSGVEDLNAELTTQESLISQLSTILDTKAGGGEQATPVISVNSTNGLITATAGTKTSTHQLAFQAAKTITPGTTNQTAVSSGYYTGGAVMVKGDSNLVAGNIKSGVSIFGVNGNYAGSGGDTSAEDGLVARTLASYANDRVKTIGSYAFYYYYSLTTVSFPAATSIDRSAFYFCTKLTTVSFPVATSIGDYAFYECSKLTTVSFPVATSIGSSAFYFCIKLTTVSFPVATSIGICAFGKCYNLKSLYLTGSSLCKLSASNAFSSTPIGGYSKSAGTYGSIYVPASLLASYKAATNWTYFSSRFVGI